MRERLLRQSICLHSQPPPRKLCVDDESKIHLVDAHWCRHCFGCLVSTSALAPYTNQRYRSLFGNAQQYESLLKAEIRKRCLYIYLFLSVSSYDLNIFFTLFTRDVESIVSEHRARALGTNLEEGRVIQ